MIFRIKFKIHLGHVWKIKEIYYSSKNDFVAITYRCEECMKRKKQYESPFSEGITILEYDGTNTKYLVKAEEISV